MENREEEERQDKVGLPLWGENGRDEESDSGEGVETGENKQHSETEAKTWVKLSRAEKKALKDQKRSEFWKTKRAKRRLKRRLEKQQQGIAEPCSLEQIEAERAAGGKLPTNPNETPEERQARREARRQRKKEAGILNLHWPRLVIDLGFESAHSDKEIRSVAQQVQHSFACVRNARRPLELHITSVGGKVEEALLRHEGYPTWQLQKHHESYYEVFAKEISRLVYLSPDAPTYLETIDPGKIYIIGGIADPNIKAGLTLSKARQHGLATAQLPVLQYSKATRKVLNVNHVVGILTEVADTGDWTAAFAKHTPTRKSYYNTGRKEEPALGDQEEGKG